MRRLLPAAAILSLAAAAVLAIGYVARLSAAVWHTSAWRTRSVLLYAAGGSAQAQCETVPNPPGAMAGWHAAAHLRRAHRLLVLQLYFDARLLRPQFGARVYVASIPTWFAELPCAIAPLLWWRDRRRRRFAPPTGFAVVDVRATPSPARYHPPP